jgi:hypothetical protein
MLKTQRLRASHSSERLTFRAFGVYLCGSQIGEVAEWSKAELC